MICVNFWFTISLHAFFIDADILDTFVEEKLESFIKNLKEFLSEASVLPTMFKVLEVVARSEGKCFIGEFNMFSWRVWFKSVFFVYIVHVN